MAGKNSVFKTVDENYADYLRDESRLTGSAEGIAFPASEEEVKACLVEAAEVGLPLTIQGGRTGITGGAVPEGGLVVNMSRMRSVSSVKKAEDGEQFITVQPGCLLSEIREAVASETDGRFFFPPDPTEASAEIGGMIACNASGARSFMYGSTRDYVRRLRVLLADGSVLDLWRGHERADGRSFSLKTEEGKTVSGTLPGFEMPSVKNAAGYFVNDHMDMLDLFIGSEGTLGVIVAADLKLVPMPSALWGVVAFFPAEEPVIDFVTRMKNVGVAAIEFFDSRVLEMLRQRKKDTPAFSEIPGIPEEWKAAVYVEFHGDSEDAIEEKVMVMSEAMSECGSDEDATWLACDEKEMSRLKDFRHAVPEAVNLLIDERRKQEPDITKLGTDLAVPDEHLVETLEMYREDLDEQSLEYVMFGHIGDNHVHVNILPRSMDDYRIGKTLYRGWAERVVAMGGTVSAEHGIGSLKKDFLEILVGSDGVEEMRATKKIFDPSGLLNKGNLF
jgi:D-lactate dehydrogenase (cytochrome)